jgi:hypothetical protein
MVKWWVKKLKHYYPNKALEYRQGLLTNPMFGWGLFKNVQRQGAQKTESRCVYRYTLSGAVCSAIPILSGQMSVFQQPQTGLNFGQVNA